MLSYYLMLLLAGLTINHKIFVYLVLLFTEYITIMHRVFSIDLYSNNITDFINSNYLTLLTIFLPNYYAFLFIVSN